MNKIKETLAYIRTKTSFSADVGITLGSGLAAFAEQMVPESEFSFSELPHFPAPSVDGHPGKLLLGKIGHVSVAILQGRIHYYEGHSPSEVVFPTRILRALGAETLILTNAAGSLNLTMQPGDFMLITDHINLTAYNPLRGPNLDSLGTRFPDMTDIYCPKLRDKMAKLLIANKINFHEGVYVGLSGPSYETPAEIRYLALIGGHAVGMSTVPEAIAAKHMNMSVLGLSCITNLGCGLSPQALSHEEVKETGKKVEAIFKKFLYEFVEDLS
ncbi:MAG: purine-nucleoside phosphorylase [Bdellovibrionales bacterium]|nr:purine-nucleoside phosphorylase [Bdellovibrionales bacterium]